MATASTNPLQVTLPCECGRSVSATTKDAGGSIPCGCGRSVAVPSLSQLRTLAGRDAYVTNPAEAIEKALRNGDNPAGQHCLMCGSSNATIYSCHATCESKYLKGQSEGASNDIIRLLTAMFVSRLLSRLIWSESVADEAQECGHDIGVSFPLPMCDLCSANTGGVTRAKVAKQMMAKVPLYKALLDRYPDMKLDVRRKA